MPKRIPIKVARDVGKQTGCRQIILLAFDGELTHVVTWGKTVEDCDQAAQGGNLLKKKWGWPESMQAEPSRVKKLRDRIRELEAQMKGDWDRAVEATTPKEEGAL
jgi:hypothetical protein